MSNIQRRTFLKAASAVAVGAWVETAHADEAKPALSMIVMDPLAAPLACPCVKGYAQRDYEKLAKFIEAKIGHPVKCHFGETLGATLVKKSQGKADIIIGKESVVRLEAEEYKIATKPIASLSGKDGKTTMTGLVVVAGKDTALAATDLKGYRIHFGDPHCDEKYKAPLAFFKELGVTTPKDPETCATCTDGATKVIDGFKKGEKVAAVISSYAQPLLEGCGTIEKGDLRVVGETEPVPFVVAFANGNLPEGLRAEIEKALLSVGESKELLTALETKHGFIALPAKKK